MSQVEGSEIDESIDDFLVNEKIFNIAKANLLIEYLCWDVISLIKNNIVFNANIKFIRKNALYLPYKLRTADVKYFNMLYNGYARDIIKVYKKLYFLIRISYDELHYYEDVL